MLGMVVELQGDHTILKRSLLRILMFRKRLGMYKELYELLRQEMLQMFSTRIAMLKKDKAEHNDFLLADADQMEEIKKLSVNICMMARVQQATTDSDEGSSYDSRFISEKCSDQHDNELELLARNAYKEAKKQLILAKKFPEEVKVMMDVFDSMESKLDATLRQNEILTERLLEATLIHDIEKCVLMCSGSMNDELHAEIEKVKRDSVDVQENLLKQIKILENDFQRCQK
ncbi:hypothetical protein Tco_0033012 [Tanacetum coccineum]